MRFLFVAVLICFGFYDVNAEPVRGDNVTIQCAITKPGPCPSTAINPSRYACTDHTQCKGKRICCLSSGLYVCSDPADGSKSSAKCPTTITDHSNPCYSDINCDAGSNSPPKTCCFDEATCASYCAEDATTDPATNPATQLNSMKVAENCPSTLKNSFQDCAEQSDCPRNQHCCLNGGRKRCSDPQVLIQGTCPDPAKLPFGLPCAADIGCNGVYTGKKCCRFDDAHYRCAYPEDGSVSPVTPSPTPPPTPVTPSPTPPPTPTPVTPSPTPPPTPPPITPPPITPNPTPSINPPLTPTLTPPAPVCPRKITWCPYTMTACQDILCQADEICCQDRSGVKKCTKPLGTKPGNCPPSNTVSKDGGECIFDSNCRGSLKCCGGRACSYYSCVGPDNSF